jgi:tetratricopeptide (TPR) repeat protein
MKGIIMVLAAALVWGTAAAGPGVQEAFDLRLGGDADAAVAALEKDFAEHPGDAAALFEMARVRCYLFDFSACLAAIDRAVELEPGNARYHYFSGIFSIYAVIDAAHHKDEEKMKELGQRALAELEAAVEADPDYHEARYLLVQQLTDLAPELGLDSSGREEHVEILEAKDPIWGIKARCCLLDDQEKREMWTRMMEERGDEARVCYQAAEGFLDLNEVYRAAKCLDKALELDGDRSYLLLRMVVAYAMKEDWQRATEAGDRYLEHDPPRPLQAWTMFSKAKIKQRQGDKEGGEAFLAKAEQLDPQVWKTFMPPAEILFEAP